MKRFGETWKCKVQDKNGTYDKNKVEGLVKKWWVFFREKLEQDREFRSEDLQKTEQWKRSSGKTA